MLLSAVREDVRTRADHFVVVKVADVVLFSESQFSPSCEKINKEYESLSNGRVRGPCVITLSQKFFRSVLPLYIVFRNKHRDNQKKFVPHSRNKLGRKKSVWGILF